MNARHILFSLWIGILIICLGTVGYMAVEGWNFSDSLFMTITTLSTVGYGEVHKLTEKGRILSMALILVGVGYFFYVAGAVVQFMLHGQIRKLLGARRLEKKIQTLSNHYIVCGYGRIGRIVCRILTKKPLDVVVVEKDESRLALLDEDRLPFVKGNATEEVNLIKAGIANAKGLVAALSSDAENVFLVLTARQLNPDIFVLARAIEDSARAKLKAAGADVVESPYDVGAAALAQRIVRPTVTGFLDLALGQDGKEVQMEEIPVGANSSLVNVMLKDSGIRQKFNLIIIAVKDAGGRMLFNPSFETVLKAGDTVVALGAEADLKRLEKELNPAAFPA